MTHIQKFWSAKSMYNSLKDVKEEDVQTLKTWIKNNENIPDFVTEEQLILFLHSCYSNLDATKKCIEQYYKLRYKAPQIFSERDCHSTKLHKLLEVLHFAILPRPTPDNNRVIFHKLKIYDVNRYCFNGGFKLFIMMIDALYAKEGPQPGLIFLFDLTGVKIGHITRLPLMTVKRSLEYLQEGIPVRLKGIHVLNTHSVIDKIMLLIRPFIKQEFFNLLHFHKPNDETVYNVIPKSCLPSNYDGELKSYEEMNEDYLKEMDRMRDLFLEEDKLYGSKSKKKKQVADIDLGRLEID